MLHPPHPEVLRSAASLRERAKITFNFSLRCQPAPDSSRYGALANLCMAKAHTLSRV